MKKILIVTASLQAAGAEKYTYELIRFLDQTQFKIEILTTDDVFINKEFPHIYYFKLKKLGYKIHTNLYRYFKINLSKTILGKIPLIKYFTYRFDRFNSNILNKKKLFKLFNKQDAVILIDALNYKYVKELINSNTYFETHLMCHQSQFDNSFKIYQNYDLTNTYNFVYIDDYQITEAKTQNIKIGNTFKFPLSIELNNELKTINKISNKSRYNIAIFTRITRIKPLNKTIEAFQNIIKKNPNYKLHIFGFIQDREYYDILTEQINYLKLNDKIVFLGHSKDMQLSCLEHKIDVVWVVSIFDFIGYAALELCLKNIPIILNNIDGSSTFKSIDNDKIIPPYFFDPKKLAEYTEYIMSENLLNDLLHNEKSKYLVENDLNTNVTKYEKHLLNSLKKNST